jgi:4-amino-4-deoxy-L-arabinose transferase-like glycosyltransferase
VLAGVLLAAVGVLQIVSTYDEFNHTWDEPLHLAAGMQLLDRGVYEYEFAHPPLVRLALAVGPYLAGVRSHGEPCSAATSGIACGPGRGYDEGRSLLYDSEAAGYERVLSLARLGVLPFFLLTLVVVWLWAGQLFGDLAAALAVFLLTTLPLLLGNAGLATNDVGATGLTLAALYLLTRWLQAPSAGRGALLGTAAGAAVMAKFSAIPYLAGSAAAILLWRWLLAGRGWTPLALVTRGRWKGVALGLLAMLTVFWATYGFGIRPSVADNERLFQTVEATFAPESPPYRFARAAFEQPVLPPFVLAVVRGVGSLAMRNREGQDSFLLGEVRSHGWWYYYVVGLAVKTPLPMLLLGLPGLALLAVRSWRARAFEVGAPAAYFLAILAFASFFSSINTGIRHVLILYPLMAIGAALAARELLHVRRRRLGGAVLAGLLVWQGAVAVAAHPDYLADFNALAGPEPEKVLLNGDLDWGQDLKRLEAKLRERGIERVAIAYSGSADLARHDLPEFTLLEPYKPVKGWVAISLCERECRSDGSHAWLKRYKPVARIGRSIDLYYID